MKKYSLRKAAGSYWLLDTKQAGLDYVPPIQINESGAYIWSLLEDGENVDELAVDMGQKYDIPLQEAKADIIAFMRSIQAMEKDTD